MVVISANNHSRFISDMANLKKEPGSGNATQGGFLKKYC